MPTYGEWQQPSYPRRVGAYYATVDDGGALKVRRRYIDGGAVERDGTILLNYTWLREMGTRLDVDDDGNFYTTSATNNNGGMNDQVLGSASWGTDYMDAEKQEMVRAAALSGVAPDEAGFSASLAHADGTSWRVVAQPGSSGSQGVQNGIRLGGPVGYLHHSAAVDIPDDIYDDPRVVGVELHPDDVPPPGSGGDYGEVLDAWLAFIQENGPNGCAASGAAIGFRAQSSGDVTVTSSGAVNWASLVTGQGPGDSLADGLIPFPLANRRVAYAFEFPSLADRANLIATYDEVDEYGRIPISLASDAIVAKPGSWASAFDGSTHITLEFSIDGLGFTQDIVYRPPRYRLIYADALPATRAPLRVVQRGNDGLSFTGGRRVLGARTLQSSNRRGAAIR